MSLLSTKGVNDLQSVAEFTQSAAQLGLQDNKKLQAFVVAADKAGALAPGKLDMGTVTNTVSTLQSTGVLPTYIQEPAQVITLVHSTRNLGVNSSNFQEKVQQIMNLSQQFGFQNAQGSGAQTEGKAINWHKLHFSPYKFQDISELDIKQAINDHARLSISGTLAETADTQTQDYVQQTTYGTPVALRYIDRTGGVKCLFQGIVSNVRQRTIAGLRHLDIEAISYSYMLDNQMHSRSFQRHQEPYRYILERVNKLAREYIPGLSGDVVAAQDSEASKQTGKLIIQYQESDWAFLKRICSHFNLGLVPDITFDSPKIYFGLPPEQQTDSQTEGSDKEAQQGPELNVSSYQIRRDTTHYAAVTSNSRKNSGQTFSENDFTYCIVHSLDILKLGQKVTFLDLTWYIRDIHTVMEKGAIKNIYTLTTKPGLMQDDLYNAKLAGISLQNGTVKEVVKDQVRVHITDIDAEYDEGTQWFFSYTTIYSSPDGSGFYCMPEVGDRVRIYFSNNHEEEAVAASSVNLTPSKRGKREDPNTKIISTVHGKQIILTPGGIQIIANGNLLMTLTDEGGLTIKSDKEIKLDAQEDIKITSKQGKVIVTGQNEVNLTQSGSNINLNSLIKMGGNKVKMQP